MTAKPAEEFAAEHIGRFVLQIASLQAQIVSLGAANASLGAENARLKSLVPQTSAAVQLASESLSGASLVSSK